VHNKGTGEADNSMVTDHVTMEVTIRSMAVTDVMTTDNLISATTIGNPATVHVTTTADNLRMVAIQNVNAKEAITGTMSMINVGSPLIILVTVEVIIPDKMIEISSMTNNIGHLAGICMRA